LSICNVDPNDPSQGSLLTKGAAKFQAFGQVLSKQGYTKTTEITEQQFKKIKKRENIWDVILKCLLNPQKNNNYKYRSNLLDSDVIVEVFKIPKGSSVSTDVLVEIACTQKSFSMNFKSKDNKSVTTINTPICWVKSVYIPNTYSSFGNYASNSRRLGQRYDIGKMPLAESNFWRPHGSMCHFIEGEMSRRGNSYPWPAILWNESVCRQAETVQQRGSGGTGLDRASAL
jgi:hypothetical protein